MAGSKFAAVCDAGPLIHLGEIGRAGLLAQFSPLLIPQRVWNEARSFVRPADLITEVVAVSNSDRESTARRACGKLDAGEIDCLSVCLRESSLLFLTDDLSARKEAARLGVPVHGSVGIIVRACRVGMLTLPQADESLQALGECRSLFVSRTVIELGREQLRLGGR
jgi:predicted nucleic acid-binding protein